MTDPGYNAFIMYLELSVSIINIASVFFVRKMLNGWRHDCEKIMQTNNISSLNSSLHKSIHHKYHKLKQFIYYVSLLMISVH